MRTIGYCCLFIIPVVVNAILSVPSRVDVSYDVISQSYRIISDTNQIDQSVATAQYYVNYNNSGWNYLDISMSSNVRSFDDHMIGAKAMGYAEGFTTCETIQTFWPNFYSGMFGDEAPGNNTIAFLKQNYLWMRENALKYGFTDEYWYTVHTTLMQVEGLYEGFVDGCVNQIEKATVKSSDNPWATLDEPTLEHFLLLNAWGDLYQITRKLLEPGQFSRFRGNKKLSTSGHDMKLVERCSAIIKLLPGNEDVVFGHATWDTYESLYPRIIKHYSFPLIRPSSTLDKPVDELKRGIVTIPYSVYFSASPGLLSSVDDFYTVSGYSKLGVMETTNSLYNQTILALVKPSSILCWVRVVVSNQVAKTGYNWAETFSRYHSGTYTNQWMVLDLPLFTSGSSPSSGFLTVFEEVPGLVHYEDQTEFLTSNTYWPSYNNPFFVDIFNAAGYDKLCEKSAEFCHDTDPRALLFAEYHSEIVDISGGQWILAYNDWQHDAASDHDSCSAVACRGDLEILERSRGAFGALDAKVTSALSLQSDIPDIYARLGPTYDQQPVFCWSSYADEAEYSHNGHPDCFDFAWNVFPPTL